ncbi:hypothetical protein K438DRAFT_1782262 [Mycena galopus ATCC 62051]|nr:hypothetical protein K438DRAFT_1782262 [Mycena galopus ATCC 62051]
MEEPVGDGTGVNALDVKKMVGLFYSSQMQSTLLHQALAEAHFDDPNLNPRHMIMLEDERPYLEVQSAVANTDVLPFFESRRSCLTAFFPTSFDRHIWVGGPTLDLSRPPRVAAYIPRWCIMGVNLNPGSFTVMEHVLITVLNQKF